MDITIEELKERLDKGEKLNLFDVREEYEFDEFNLNGKLIPLGSFERNSGLLITGGLGFMQHKLKFTFQRTVLPQLENNYYKGYDRLTNGLMVRGFFGYQRIDPKGRMNFYAGMELLNGFTKNRRSYNYDTRKADTELRNDMLLGLKIGIMISLSGRQAGNKKGEEERFFE